MTSARQGACFGLLAVAAFGLTLPATRLAVASLDPVLVGLGRGVIAALPAALLLWLTRQPLPTAAQWKGLAIVVFGSLIGFPLSVGWAMRHTEAFHGGVVLGLLPLATTCAAFLRAGEKPSLRFWLCSLAGSTTVIGFSLASSNGPPGAADGALLAAVGFAAIGYAEGGRLSRELGGWQVMCWALLLAFPIMIGPAVWIAFRHGLEAGPAAWGGFAYLCTVSSFLGMFAWYHGLALGGVAKVGQLQLLQPFFTFLFSAAFLGERFGWSPVVCATLVATFIVLGRRESPRARTIAPPSPAPMASCAEK